MASTEASPETAIVPRWEWRTFGERFDVAEDELGALAPDRIEESDETYLLSLDGTDTVKVRGGLVDIKHLEEVSDEGLERWMPVMKAAFPLAAGDVGATLTALGVAIASPPGDVPTVEELLAELVEPNPRLLAIGVRKRRGRFTLDGCMVELTEVDTDSGATRTVAVESPDLQLVVATVRRLGLEGRPNVSYPRALKALAGFGALTPRGHRRRHQLRQVLHRRARRGRWLADDRGSSRGDPARRRSARDRPPEPGAGRPHHRGDCGDGR